MTNPLPIMPLFVDDYLNDTKRFTYEEHGVYLVLLMNMWREGGSIPYDETDIQALLKLSPADYARLSARILPLLETYKDRKGLTRLTQRRLQKVLSYTQGKKRKLSEAGKKGVTARILKRKAKLSNASSPALSNRSSPALSILESNNNLSSLQVAARESSPHKGEAAHDTGKAILTLTDLDAPGTDTPPADAPKDKAYLFKTEFMKRSGEK